MSQRGSSLLVTPPRLAIGTPAIDLVLGIPKLCPEIKMLTFLSYSPGIILEKRLKASTNPSVKEILCDWNRIKRQAQIDVPLFDLIMGSRLKTADFNTLIEDVLYHRPEKHIYKAWMISARQLTREKIEYMKREGGADTGLALTSVVRVRGGRVAHLPLMDFRCNRNRDNLRKLISLFSVPRQQLPNRGYILKTQHSYHFYGLNVLTKRAWLKFLARCLLLGSLTDSRYVAHCMLHGQSTLRITESPQHNDTPRISAFVGSKTDTCG